MNCNCRWTELVLALVILIVAIWPSWFGAGASMWITIIAAAILLLHSLFHHRCGCEMCMDQGNAMPARKASRRKRR